MFFFFFKQKTAYEMRISDWSSDVCSSDLRRQVLPRRGRCAMGASFQATASEKPCGRMPSASGWTAKLERRAMARLRARPQQKRSEEHTSELQSLMRISYAVFCLKKKNITQKQKTITNTKIIHEQYT